jgi:hypothetical protein
MLEEPISEKHTTVVLQMPSYGGEILEGRNIGFVEYESWKNNFQSTLDLNKHESLNLLFQDSNFADGCFLGFGGQPS